MRRVVDASALAALAFGEPEAEAVAQRLGEAELAAPSLLPYELASVCAKKVALHPHHREALLASLRLVADLHVETVEAPGPDLVELAEAVGITTYDAAYLWVARFLEVPLVTLDRKLERAARALGVASA